MPIIDAISASSISVPMEFIKYEPEFNPDSIINYYSCGIHSGRTKNQDVKFMISKAKSHLSAIGWSFFYVLKSSGRRELRYRSPSGRNYCSLRSACQDLIDSQQQYDRHDPDSGNPKTEIRFKNPEKKSKKQSKNRVYYHDLGLGSPKIETFEEVPEKKSKNNDIEFLSDHNQSKNRVCQDLELVSPMIETFEELETKLEKINHDPLLSDNRPKKKIRIEEVESLYYNFANNNYTSTIEIEKNEGNFPSDQSYKIRVQDSGIHENKENEGFSSGQPKKRLRDVKRLLEFGKRTVKIKPKKRIRKVEGSSTRRRCVLSVLIGNNIVKIGSRVYYRKKDGKSIAKGRVYDEGIKCDCCGMFFLLSKFEAHAGSTYHRPAAYIFLEDGRSLLDCQTQLKHENEAIPVAKSSDNNRGTGHDEFCSFCKEGGELLLCDSCTSSFHSGCVGLNGIPDSDYWFCPSCGCGICDDDQGDSHANYGKIKCVQCEHQYHVACVRKLGFKMSNDDATTNWFCSDKCEQIHSGLMSISGRSIPLCTDNLSWSLLKLDDEHETETYSKLNVALDVMHECFEPVKHPWSESDVVEDVIFSRCTKSSNFSGFFTAVLEKDEEMITAVNIRVHGCKVAEIPLVATRFQYRRLGMCRILMDEVERKLGSLGVERVVLAAVPEMVSTWTESFGFSVMTEAERFDVVKCKFLEFPGTIKCQKILKKM